MFTLLVTVLAGLVIGAIVLKLIDSIVVEHHTISTRDLPNIAASDGRTDRADTAPARYPGGIR